MRLLAAFIAIQLGFFGVSVAAEPLADRVVGLLDEVCVSPVTPEAMLSAGEKLAAAEKWKLVSSGPMPFPFMHGESNPKVSLGSGWELDLPEGSRLQLAVSIMGPDWPGVKHSICVLQPSVDIDRDGLTEAIARQFGSAVTKSPSRRPTDDDIWFFTKEKAAGNCGKQITVVRNQLSSKGRPKTTVFTDLAYPNDGRWTGLLDLIKCRS
jgi:hypothetical protein